MDGLMDYADGVDVEDLEYGYGQEEDIDDYEYDADDSPFNDEGFSFQETVEHCVLPTTNDAIGHIGKLLFWCFVLRIIVTLSSGRTSCMVHLASALIGCLVLHHFFTDLLVTFVVHAALSYVTLAAVTRLAPRYAGLLVTAVSLTFVLSCELWLVEAARWHSVRGAQMILMMKAVSAGLDGSPAAPPPGPLQYAGYLLHPGTVVFGPWIALADYTAAVHTRPAQLASMRWVVTSVGSLVLGLVFMTVSTCWLNWLLPDRLVLISMWIVAYREALSFRSSHYFVSFVSQAAANVSGITSAVWSPSGELLVSRPTAIEAPRSLVEVVVNWNLPMHYWLKTYVFRVARPAGTAAAVLCTYGASAVLHGLNFQLAAVLLSLGVYTYTEHRLRGQLGDALGLCVLARRCAQPCSRHAGAGRWAARALNLPLALLAAFHLAYLGVVFDGSSAGASGYHWRHTLDKWEALGFASHWVAAGSLVVTWLL
ncbi:protein-serine O-palmitoleoyltransferase porcupine-like [Pollicipes pollicipes]|uniref:protein-serine O-palmitoleoyltransferase porcupine-like n=1 Tax=Pollicipes pollicipes TaxID=41117 RepID=UPI0018851319|nr:protein-serine O-palmitoleoyltransferase porcupine-like [Pollicipes pollicipes]